MERPPATVRIEDLLAHREWMRQVARALVHDDARADDLEQEVWTSALQRPPAERGLPLRGWLGTVLRFKAIDQRRSEVRRRAREEAVAREERQPSAGEAVARGEILKRVVVAVMDLEEPYRTAVLLRYFEDLSPPAIAAQLGVPLETVRTRLRRALAQLRERLDREHRGDRRKWALLLLPFARRPEPAVAGSSLVAGIAGAIFVTIKTKGVLAAAAVLLLASAAWWSRPIETQSARPARPEVSARPQTPAVAPVPVPVPARSPRSVEKDTGPAVAGRVQDPEGGPIAGATVLALPNLDPWSGGPKVPAAKPSLSGADGRFRLPLPPVAPAFRLAADAVGFAPGGYSPVRDGDEVTLTLERPISLLGRVQDQEGRPVGGASVRFLGRLSGALFVRAAVSGSDGAYRLDGLPTVRSSRDIGLQEEESVILAEAAGFAPLSVRWFPGDAKDPRLDLYLVRGAVLEGRVVEGESGGPMPGARVLLWTYEHMGIPGAESTGLIPVGSGGSALLGETVADAEGKFQFEGVPAAGVHEVRANASGRRGQLLGVVGAMAPGYAPGTDEVPAVRDGARVEAEIRLWPTASVAGRIVDQKGKPVFGVQVWELTVGRLRGWFPAAFKGVPPSKAITDADGRYLLEGVPALRASAVAHLFAATPAQVRLMGQDMAQMEVSVRAGETSEAPDIVLGSGTVPSAVVHVTDAQGRPVWGARASFDQFAGEATSERDGRLQFWFTYNRAGIPPGPVTLIVRAPGCAPAATPSFTPSVEEPPEVRVTLSPGGAISGRALREDGRPASHATIWVSDSAVAEGTLFPDGRLPLGISQLPPEGMPRLILLGVGTAAEDGSFEIADLPPGPFRIRAQAPPGTATLEGIRAGARDLVLTLPSLPPPPTASVDVTISDAGTGKPVQAATAFLTRKDASGRTTWANGDGGSEPGLRRWSGIAAGDWSLRVEAPGFVPSERTVTVGGGEPVRVAVSLERGATVRGSVAAEEGVEARDLIVWFARVGVPLGGRAPHATLGTDATYEVAGLSPGRWRAMLVRPSPGEPYYAVAGSAEVEVPAAGGDLHLDFRVVRAGLLTVHLEGESSEFAPAELIPFAVRDGEGREVHRGVIRGVAQWEFVPVVPGTVTVSLEIPGKDPIVRAATVVAGARTDISVRLP